MTPNRSCCAATTAPTRCDRRWNPPGSYCAVTAAGPGLPGSRAGALGRRLW
jgi:hypothetical protein